MKRKRDDDLPRISFDASGRNFERLFKEESLDELKEVVRKKLRLPEEAPIALWQNREGRRFDLEDDDDFEAFSAAAQSVGALNVTVDYQETPSHFNAQQTSVSTATVGVQGSTPDIAEVASLLDPPNKKRKVTSAKSGSKKSSARVEKDSEELPGATAQTTDTVDAAPEIQDEPDVLEKASIPEEKQKKKARRQPKKSSNKITEPPELAPVREDELIAERAVTAPPSIDFAKDLAKAIDRSHVDPTKDNDDNEGTSISEPGKRKKKKSHKEGVAESGTAKVKKKKSSKKKVMVDVDAGTEKGEEVGEREDAEIGEEQKNNQFVATSDPDESISAVIGQPQGSAPLPDLEPQIIADSAASSSKSVGINKANRASRRKTSSKTTTASCPLCLETPQHFVYNCPIVVAGPKALKKRTRELEQESTTDPALLEELQVMLSNLTESTREAGLADEGCSSSRVSRRRKVNEPESVDSGFGFPHSIDVEPPADVDMDALVRGPVPREISAIAIESPSDNDSETSMNKVVLEEDEDVPRRRKQRKSRAKVQSSSSSEEDADDTVLAPELTQQPENGLPSREPSSDVLPLFQDKGLGRRSESVCDGMSGVEEVNMLLANEKAGRLLDSSKSLLKAVPIGIPGKDTPFTRPAESDSVPTGSTRSTEGNGDTEIETDDVSIRRSRSPIEDVDSGKETPPPTNSTTQHVKSSPSLPKRSFNGTPLSSHPARAMSLQLQNSDPTNAYSSPKDNRLSPQGSVVISMPDTLLARNSALKGTEASGASTPIHISAREDDFPIVKPDGATRTPSSLATRLQRQDLSQAPSLTQWEVLKSAGESQSQEDTIIESEQLDELLSSSPGIPLAVRGKRAQEKKRRAGPASQNGDVESALPTSRGRSRTPLFLQSQAEPSTSPNVSRSVRRKTPAVQLPSPASMDDEQEVARAIKSPLPSLRPTPSQSSYRGLRDLVMDRKFSTPDAVLRSSSISKSKEELDPYGRRRGEQSDDSESSASDSDEAEASHIPKSRKAGVKSGRR